MSNNSVYLLILTVLTTIKILITNTIIDEHFCGTLDLPLNPLLPKSRGHIYFGRLTIRLSVYYDSALLNKYNNDIKAVEEFIYRTMNSVSMSYRHSSIRQIADFSFHIKKIGLYKNEINEHAEGQLYRRDFCSFVKHPHHIDESLAASVLLTGAMYSETSSTQGFAHINVACKWSERQWNGHDPCALVEGRQFKAAFILAHELGHIFGMNHDENVSCDDQHIMSESTGDGKTLWSECSINQLVRYLEFLRKTSYWCLKPDDNNWEFPIKYRSTSSDEQCRTALGPNFHRYYAWNRKTDICYRLECTDDTIRTPIHPAIENTICDSGKACIEGQCRRY